MDDPIRQLYRELFDPNATWLDALFWFLLGMLTMWLWMRG